VSAPKFREEKPDLAFKAPTWYFRVSRNLSTRQGGSQYLTDSGMFLIFLALTDKVFRERIIRERIIIEMLYGLYSPFLRILPLQEDLNGVYSIDSRNLRRFILPPE